MMAQTGAVTVRKQVVVDTAIEHGSSWSTGTSTGMVRDGRQLLMA
jgi:hypothetical protein